MVLFRNATRQALRRAGYHATFMCRPPFEHIMSSGWHLHQSVCELATGRNVFMRDAPAQGNARDARQVLSDEGAGWLAGLLAHAPALTALCTATSAFGPTPWRRSPSCGAATTGAPCCA
jgi:glutamine synthetase